jgi:hypothetical protein
VRIGRAERHDGHRLTAVLLAGLAIHRTRSASAIR